MSSRRVSLSRQTRRCAAGRLQPGERAVVKFTFTAPLVPLLVDAFASCEVVVDEEAVLAAVEAAQQQEAAEAAAAGVEFTGAWDEGSHADSPARRLPLSGVFADVAPGLFLLLDAQRRGPWWRRCWRGTPTCAWCGPAAATAAAARRRAGPGTG